MDFDGFGWILMDFDGTNVTKTYKNCVLFLAARNHRSQPQGSLHGARPQRCGVGPLPARISAESIQRSRAPLGVEKHPLCWHPGNQFVTFVLPKYAQKKVQMERLMGLMGVNKKKSKLRWFSLNFNKCIHVLHDSRFFDLCYGWICLLELCGKYAGNSRNSAGTFQNDSGRTCSCFLNIIVHLGGKNTSNVGIFHIQVLQALCSFRPDRASSLNCNNMQYPFYPFFRTCSLFFVLVTCFA